MRLEHEEDYANKGVAGAGLGLGIAGTALGLLNGGLGNLGIGGVAPRNICSEDHSYTRYDASKDARIAELETEVKLRDANTFSMGEVNKLRDYVERRFDSVEGAINAQAVYNATNSSVIGCLTNQVNQLAALTKVVVPTSSICPEPMLKYNSWTAPTTSTTT